MLRFSTPNTIIKQTAALSETVVDCRHISLTSRRLFEKFAGNFLRHGAM